MGVLKELERYFCSNNPAEIVCILCERFPLKTEIVFGVEGNFKFSGHSLYKKKIINGLQKLAGGKKDNRKKTMERNVKREEKKKSRHYHGYSWRFSRNGDGGKYTRVFWNCFSAIRNFVINAGFFFDEMISWKEKIRLTRRFGKVKGRKGDMMSGMSLEGVIQTLKFLITPSQ